MKRMLCLIGLTLLAGACAHHEITTSADAKRALDERYKKEIGAATKADFVEAFGEAQWCRPQPGGEETCRFYNRLETKWGGDKLNRTHYDTYDQVVAVFDTNGTLKSFESTAQR